MKKNCIVLYFLLFAAALFLTAYSGSVPKEEPQLQLELWLSKNKYEAGEPIECKALLTYTGKEDEMKVHFRNPMIVFAVDGGKYLHKDQYGWWSGGSIRDITRVLQKGDTLEIPFQKQQYNNSFLQRNDEDEAEKSFWENYLSSSDLMLEPGRYTIFAHCSYSLSGFPDWPNFQYITVSEKITVK